MNFLSMSAFCLAVWSAIPFSLSAQTHAPLKFKPDVAGAIDGSKTPEFIPDGLAWKMFLRSVSEPSDATGQQKARLLAKISRLGLSNDDTVVLIKVLAGFDKEIKEKDKALSAIDENTPWQAGKQAMSRISQEIEGLVSATVDDLAAHMSSDGLVLLKSHIHEIKAKISIVPLPAMPE